jgi:hypothetical protein
VRLELTSLLYESTALPLSYDGECWWGDSNSQNSYFEYEMSASCSHTSEVLSEGFEPSGLKKGNRF